jgi:hypothetical protein
MEASLTVEDANSGLFKKPCAGNSGKGDSMSSKLSFSMVAALILLAGAARATPHAELSAGESGIPDSIDYPLRAPGTYSPSKEQIEALESGNPDSVRYADRSVPFAISQADWMTLELGNPDYR